MPKKTLEKQQDQQSPESPLTDRSADPEIRLQQLQNRIRGCTDCPLYKTRTQAVPGDGASTAKIVMLGEAPGKTEDAKGHVFIGPAGKVLDQILAHNKLLRDQDVYITNTICCIPWKEVGVSIRAPHLSEKRACKKHLDELFDILQPKVIVPLGAHALNYFAPHDKISTVHGRVLGNHNPPLIPMFHPAVVLHQNDSRDKDRMKRVLEKDFAQLRKLIKMSSKTATHHPWVTVKTVLALNALISRCREANIFAFDFETTHSDARTASLVGMSVSFDGETGYYIPTRLIPARLILGKFKRLFVDPSIRKITHNGGFELHILAQYFRSYNILQNHVDTKMAAYLQGEITSELKDLSIRHLDYSMTHIEELIGIGKNQLSMADVSVSRVAPYASDDAVVTFRLWKEVYEEMYEPIS